MAANFNCPTIIIIIIIIRGCVDPLHPGTGLYWPPRVTSQAAVPRLKSRFVLGLSAALEETCEASQNSVSTGKYGHPCTHTLSKVWLAGTESALCTVRDPRARRKLKGAGAEGGASGAGKHLALVPQPYIIPSSQTVTPCTTSPAHSDGCACERRCGLTTFNQSNISCALHGSFNDCGKSNKSGAKGCAVLCALVCTHGPTIN